MASLTFHGIETLPAKPVAVGQLLTDLDLLATLLPDVTEHQLLNSTAAKWTVRPGFSFLRGTLHLDICREDAKEHGVIRLRVFAQGIGVGIEMESQLNIQPAEAGTQVVWQTDVTKLSGLVATVGKSLIQGAAEATIRKTWVKIREYCEKLPAADGSTGEMGKL